MEEVRAITVHSQSNIDAPGFVVTRTGLVVNGQPTFAEWACLGGQLSLAEKAIHWAIGDWLNYGAWAYAEKYAQALDDTRFEYQTLANDKWLADKIEFSRRRENLSWSHHAEVGGKEPEEQDYWLGLAEQNDWKRSQLREAIRQGRVDRREALPEPVKAKGPRLIVGRAEGVPQIESDSVDLIITSPPYNLGDNSWPMGGDGRVPRVSGIGYTDALSEGAYQEWQTACLVELYRVAKPGASLFYNHKIRSVHGEIVHPMDWLRDERNPWMLRQEIVWDRGSTHNHSATLFWPEDERVYWMTKGKPTLPDRPVGMSTVWRFHGPVVDTWHPAPFAEELPKRCIMAVGRTGITVLDPFAGSCTTLKVALEYGYDAIGVDVCAEYLARAAEENGWTMPSGA